MSNNYEEWDIEISADKKWYELHLKEVFKYKDLIKLLVKRSFTSQYKQTILGPLWFIINPLLTTIISSFIFGGVAGIQSDGIPYFLFYLVGYTLWNYFSTCVSSTASTFTANAGIMGKVYFPRLTMPISSVIYAAVNMLVIFIMSIIVLLLYVYKGVVINVNLSIIMIPVFMIQTALLALGVGIIISSLTTKYRDLAILVSFGLSLWMYLTPVVYPLSEIPYGAKTLILLNPMSSIINNYRYVLLGVGEFEIYYWIISLIETIVLFFVGVILFNKVERTFMDTV